MKKSISILLFLLSGHWAAAQYIYVGGAIAYTTEYKFGYFNYETCTYCLDFTVPITTIPSMVSVSPLPNGNVVVVEGDGKISVFDPPSATPIFTINLPVSTSVGGSLGPDGKIYITTVAAGVGGAIYTFDPMTNSVMLVGTYPLTPWILKSPFFWNGEWYAFANEVTPPNDGALLKINMSNPLTFDTIYLYPGNTNDIGCYSPYGVTPDGIFSNASCTTGDLLQFDFPGNEFEVACAVTYPFSPSAQGISGIPAGFPPPPAICGCLTEAGGITTPNTFLCAGAAFDFTDIGSFLESGDMLGYILFSNPADTLGSIVATSNTPSFAFNSTTMLAGVTYYAATVAGNNMNGNVDLNDPCLDISNAVQVLWRPLPTVTFSAANPNVCINACTTVTATFTGTAPFTLTYTSPASGTVTQTFSGNTGTFQVCSLPGSPPGSLVVQATELVDAFCNCN